MTLHTIHRARQVRMMPGICRCLHCCGDWDKIAETPTSLKSNVYICSTAGLIRYCATNQFSTCTLSSIVSNQLNSLTTITQALHAQFPGGNVHHRMRRVVGIYCLKVTYHKHQSKHSSSRPLTLHTHCRFSHCPIAACMGSYSKFKSYPHMVTVRLMLGRKVDVDDGCDALSCCC